ncbi:MAG TPA: protease modulator HflC [Steroidobacteraceae bacterium]|nr:protease modulator HflC [Steroidobacteraceae bacterium]
MTRSNLLILVSVILVALIFATSTFTVPMTHSAIKLRFGEIVESNYQPGLHFKVPLLEDVHKFEKRVLTVPSTPEEKFLTSEGKILLIDFFIKWRIEVVNRYYQATCDDETVAARRLSDIIKDGLKGIIARHTLQEVVQRTEFIDELRSKSLATTAQLGIKLVDVRVKKINLPEAVRESVFNRMSQDFKQQATKLRAEGEENSLRLRAEADRQRTEILAEATRQSEITRGEGDAKSTETYAKAYMRNPEFYAFYRSMQAYREALGKSTDVMVISPESDFFKYLKQPNAH